MTQIISILRSVSDQYLSIEYLGLFPVHDPEIGRKDENLNSFMSVHLVTHRLLILVLYRTTVPHILSH